MAHGAARARNQVTPWHSCVTQATNYRASLESPAFKWKTDTTGNQALLLALVRFSFFFFFQFALLAPKTPLRTLGAPHFKHFTPLRAQQNTINSSQKWIAPFQNLKNVINNKSCWQKYLIECSVSIQMLEACPLTGKLLVFCNQLQFVKLVVKIAWSYFIFPNSEWWMCWLFFFFLLLFSLWVLTK